MSPTEIDKRLDLTRREIVAVALLAIGIVALLVISVAADVSPIVGGLLQGLAAILGAFLGKYVQAGVGRAAEERVRELASQQIRALRAELSAAEHERQAALNTQLAAHGATARSAVRHVATLLAVHGAILRDVGSLRDLLERSYSREAVRSWLVGLDNRIRDSVIPGLDRLVEDWHEIAPGAVEAESKSVKARVEDGD